MVRRFASLPLRAGEYRRHAKGCTLACVDCAQETELAQPIFEDGTVEGIWACPNEACAVSGMWIECEGWSAVEAV